MQYSDIDALYYNWSGYALESPEGKSVSRAINEKLEAFGLSFPHTDEILCEINRRLEAGQRQAYYAGFRTAVNLIFQEGVQHEQSYHDTRESV